MGTIAFQSVEINESAFNALPEKRRAAVMDTFSKAPQGIKRVINNLAGDLNVEGTRTYVDREGNTRYEGCHYSPSYGIIRMNPCYDDDEYAEVFRHEFGHMVDDKYGDLSGSQAFIDALSNDVTLFSSNSLLKREMLNDLAASFAMDDRCVSDILSGAFNNDAEIIARYEKEFAGYYSHDNDYWSGVSGPVNARGKETFANMFSIYSTIGRDDSIAFLEKYFPCTTAQFKSLLNI